MLISLVKNLNFQKLNLCYEKTSGDSDEDQLDSD